MTEMTRFETRLAELLEADSRAAVRPVDRYAIARTVIDEGASRRRWGGFAGRRRWLPLALTLLLIGLMMAALFVGSRVLETEEPLPELTIAPTGSLMHVRAGHAATLLEDGRVLITGGHGGTAGCGFCAEQTERSAELYDPTTRSFVATGPMQDRRTDHTSTRLDDGRVLVVGAAVAATDTYVPANGAELYEPATGSFGVTGSPITARSSHAAVLLADGRVAIVGGIDQDGNPANPSIELFDPVAGTFSPGPTDAALERAQPAAVVLQDGRVVVAGGSEPTTGGRPEVAEAIAIWDPKMDSVELTPVPGAVGAMTLLPDGDLLLAVMVEASRWEAMVLEPDTWSAAPVASLPGRPALPMSTMVDGRVVGVAEVDDACDDSETPETEVLVLDVTTGLATGLGPLPAIGHCSGSASSTVTPLLDGSVLLTGGLSGGGETRAAATVVESKEAQR